MQYVKVKGKEMSLKYIWKVATDLAQALQSLHIKDSNRVIIHKDLKLENIFVNVPKSKNKDFKITAEFLA